MAMILATRLNSNFVQLVVFFTIDTSTRKLSSKLAMICDHHFTNDVALVIISIVETQELIDLFFPWLLTPMAKKKEELFHQPKPTPKQIKADKHHDSSSFSIAIDRCNLNDVKSSSYSKSSASLHDEVFVI